MTTPPLSPDDAERVKGWLLAWLRSEVSEDWLTKQMNIGMWRIEGATWTLWQALRGHVHAVIVQFREASAEHWETEPRECGSGERPVWIDGHPRWIPECTGADTCGVHREWVYAFDDLTAMFVGQLITQVPIRAAASVEASMAAVRDRVVGEKRKGKT